MSVWLAVPVTLAIAVAAGWVAKKCRLPAGAMVGAMLGVAAFSIFTGSAYLPSYSRSIVQIFSGALLGHTIGRQDVAKLKSIWKSAVCLILSLIVLNLALGYGLHKLFNMDMATALFSSAPGGVSDMALIADELQADTAKVSILQLSRIIFIFLVYPPTFRAIARKTMGKGSAKEGSAPAPARAKRAAWFGSRVQVGQFFLTMLCGATGGIIALLLGIPAGPMMGSMLASAAFNIGTGKAYFPGGLRFFIQCAAGAIIGLRMTADSFRSLGTLVLPVLALAGGLFIFTGILGVIMWKVSKMDLPTSLMSVSPGGIQEMSLMADDLGCDTAQVLALQTVRLMVVISIFPTLLKWVVSLGL